MPFIIKTVAQEYEIHFEYMMSTKEKPLFSYFANEKGKINVLPAKMITLCRIVNENKDAVGAGVTYCSASDKISFQQGRIHSFTRALQAMNLPRVTRSYWWEEFFNVFGQY